MSSSSSAGEQMAAAMATMTPLEQGEYLQAIAYTTPPLKPRGLALAIVVVAIVLVAATTILTGLRIYVRRFMKGRNRGFGWEDVWGILSWGTFVTFSTFLIKASTYSVGFHDVDLTMFHQIRAGEYLIYCVCFYCCSMPLVKASVMCQVLAFARQRYYRWALYFFLFIGVVFAGVAVAGTLTHCRPVRAYWNPLVGECGDVRTTLITGYTWTVAAIISDAGFIAVPFLIIKDLQMSRRRKNTVMGILALGFTANVAAIVRAPYLNCYLVEVDRLYWNGHLFFWSVLEYGFGIMATSLPSLRSLFAKYIDKSGNRSYPSRQGYGHGHSGTGGSKGASAVVSAIAATTTTTTDVESKPTRMTKLTHEGKEWEQLSDDGSQSGIMAETRVSSVHSHLDGGSHV